MKKDDALARRERVLILLNEALGKLELAPLVDDGKLYHDEIEGENRWAQRLSRPGVWPHVAAGQGPRAMPGLRYEVWYWQKRNEAWIALLCSRSADSLGSGPAAELAKALKPNWIDWVQGGKYARRYQPLDALWKKACPDTDGIWRSTPLDDKLDKALLTLVRDTLPGLEKAISSLGATGELARAFSEANARRDPLAELAAKFNKGK